MNRSVSARLHTLRIFWFAIISSTLMLFGVVFVVRPHSQVQHPPALPFVAVALMSAVVSVALPRFSFSRALGRIHFETREEPVATVAASYREGVPVRSVIANPDAAIEAGLGAYVTPFILAMALSESVGMLGFALGFLGAPTDVVLPLFGASLILQAARFPSSITVRRAVVRAAQAEFEV